jgi:hypothetical protein
MGNFERDWLFAKGQELRRRANAVKESGLADKAGLWGNAPGLGEMTDLSAANLWALEQKINALEQAKAARSGLGISRDAFGQANEFNARSVTTHTEGTGKVGEANLTPAAQHAGSTTRRGITVGQVGWILCVMAPVAMVLAAVLSNWLTIGPDLIVPFYLFICLGATALFSILIDQSLKR